LQPSDLFLLGIKCSASATSSYQMQTRNEGEQMKNNLFRWAIVPMTVISVLTAWQPGDANTLADGMKRLIGFTVGAVAHITNTERDERTGLMRVQLSNGMIFALRVADDQLIDTSSGDTVVCFRQVMLNVEHRLVIEDDVYAAQRLQ
jgi:hypothetical protein